MKLSKGSKKYDKAKQLFKECANEHFFKIKFSTIPLFYLETSYFIMLNNVFSAEKGILCKPSLLTNKTYKFRIKLLK